MLKSSHHQIPGPAGALAIATMPSLKGKFTMPGRGKSPNGGRGKDEAEKPKVEKKEKKDNDEVRKSRPKIRDCTLPLTFGARAWRR